MSASVTIAIRAGADLATEPFEDRDPALAAAWRGAQQTGALDGGLAIDSDGTTLSYVDVWDHVDGLLLAWLQGLDALDQGADEAVVVFPDTRVECELERRGDNHAHIEYEDVRATVDRQALRTALTDAAQRLVGMASRHGVKTPAIEQLRRLTAELGG